MSWLRTVADELLGLFVDDARFAVPILLWLAASWLVLPRLGLPGFVPPLALFGGLVVILIASAVSKAGA